MKAPKYKDKFFGEFIYAQIIDRYKSNTNYKELRGKPDEGKTTEQIEREIPINQRDYTVFSTFYYKFNYLGFLLYKRG